MPWRLRTGPCGPGLKAAISRPEAARKPWPPTPSGSGLAHKPGQNRVGGKRGIDGGSSADPDLFTILCQSADADKRDDGEAVGLIRLGLAQQSRVPCSGIRAPFRISESTSKTASPGTPPMPGWFTWITFPMAGGALRCRNLVAGLPQKES